MFQGQTAAAGTMGQDQHTGKVLRGRPALARACSTEQLCRSMHHLLPSGLPESASGCYAHWGMQERRHNTHCSTSPVRPLPRLLFVPVCHA